jgi:hypothetical protein
MARYLFQREGSAVAAPVFGRKWSAKIELVPAGLEF